MAAEPVDHNFFMQRCLELANRGLGKVAPNPMVGCVIVHQKKIIGEGFHQKYGEAHAEVNAIQSVEDKSLLASSTLYVNLEPCSHFGKTPPCVDLILKNKIPSVVIGSYDPNPLVQGDGIKKLRAAGVEVITEVNKPASDFLNRRFLTFHLHKRAYIILKWAQSADGFIARSDDQTFWFTGEESKKLSHRWRTEESSILVGKNTVNVDDCELTTRLWKGKNPTRVVIDKNLSLSRNKKIFNKEATTIVFNDISTKTEENIEYIKLDFGKNVIEQIATELYHKNLISLIVEGGSETLKHFVTANLWDEARVFVTPHILEKGKPSPELNTKIVGSTKIESDKLLTFLNSSL